MLRTTDCPTADLPGRVIALYDAMVSVASFIDQDNAIASNTASLFEPLPPDIRRAVSDLMATGAPFVRAFPTARTSDDEAGAFLARPELFEPLRVLLDLSRQRSLITEEAAERITGEVAVAVREGFQAQKAGNRALGTMRTSSASSRVSSRRFISGRSAHRCRLEDPSWRSAVARSSFKARRPSGD